MNIDVYPGEVILAGPIFKESLPDPSVVVILVNFLALVHWGLISLV